MQMAQSTMHAPLTDCLAARGPHLPLSTLSGVSSDAKAKVRSRRMDEDGVVVVVRGPSEDGKRTILKNTTFSQVHIHF
jgi:hypothetical protein